MSAPRLLAPAVADFAALSELHGSCFSERWSADAIKALLQTPGSFAFLSGDGEGFILARTAADEAEILTLAVRPVCRRHGMGAALVASAAEFAGTRGATRFFLEVGTSNLPARALYEKFGFATVGERRGYYGERTSDPQDALTLMARLPLVPLGNSRGVG